MKEKIQKVFRQNIPFVVVFVTALIWHLVIKISAGDDVVYFQTLMDGRSIWEILAHRYATWSSRMAIEFVLIPLVQVPWLWKILDFIVFTLITVLLYRLLFLNPEKYLDMECNINKTAGKWLVCAFMLLYPFSDMVSAGWIATTVNYLWPLLGLLYIALLLQKLAQKGHVHWYEGAGGVVSCIFCSSQEQVAAILLVLLFLAMVYSWRRKKSGSLWIYGYAVIDVISLFTILRCPGNGIRSMQEVEGRMPEFAYFSVWEKIYMGAANIERIFVAQVNSIFLIVSAVLAVLVGLKTKNLIKTLLSSVPVFCILGYALIRTGHPWYEKIFIIPKQTAEWNFKDPANWFPVIFLIVTVAGMSYALFCLMREKLETYFYTIAILGVGLASGIVMGFSPTIYASADRPYIYLYFILMAVCLFCIRQMRGQIRKEVPVLVLNMSAVISGLFCMVNIAETLWMCHIM